MISITSRNQFEEYLNSSTDPVVVDFSSDWCGPCKMISGTLEKMSNNIKNVRFVKVNVEQVSELAEKFGVVSIPTLVFIKDNTEVKRTVGSISESKIQNIINQSFGL